MPVPVAEVVLGLVQTTRLINILMAQYQQGTISEEEFRTKAEAMRLDVRATEASWKLLEERDAQRKEQEV